MYHYKAKLVRVIDGDTICLLMDVGFKLTQEMTFRLYGINTPEIVGIQRSEGLKAKALVQELLPTDQSIEVFTYKDRKEKYGRYLADILLPDGRKLSEVLVSEGVAERI